MWFKRFACVLFGVFLVGCSNSGSGSSNKGGGGGSQFTPVNIQGQYEVRVTDSSNPSSIALVEVNFTQASASVSASAANVVLLEGTLNNNLITLNGLGGACDSGNLGQDSVEGTFTSATAANMTLTEANSGTASATVTFSSDGSQIVSGNYSTPAQCGAPAGSGTVIGSKIQPFSGSYAGMLANSSGGTDAVIVTVTQTGLNLNVSGTDNGAQFTLTGSVVGATFEVSGTVAGQSVQAIGIYDHINNDFLVFNNQGVFLGQLNAGTNPQAVSKTGLFEPAGWRN